MVIYISCYPQLKIYLSSEVAEVVDVVPVAVAEAEPAAAEPVEEPAAEPAAAAEPEATAEAAALPSSIQSSGVPAHVPYLLIGAGTASFAAFRAIRAKYCFD